MSDKCSCRCEHGRTYFKICFDIILWLGVGIPVLYLYLEGKPYERGFFCDDLSLSYPYKPDTISNTLLTAGGFAISLLVVVMTEVLNFLDKQGLRQCFTTSNFVHCIQLYTVFLIGFVFQQMVVEVSKNYLGVLRPNFFDVCKPSFNKSLCASYISTYECTSTFHTEVISDSRQSFPSGHSTLSMYVATFFCFYIQYQLQITFSHILKFCMQFILVSAALLCGAGRISDHKHHPSDVVAGFLLGASVAVLVFMLIGGNIAKKRISSKSDNILVNTIQQTFCCCQRKQKPSLEPQTPAPLLINEYPNGILDLSPPDFVISDETPMKRKKLEIPLNIRRHFSTPITPSNRSEDMLEAD